MARPVHRYRLGGCCRTITNYLGTNLASVLANSDANNIHVYPQQAPNASDSSGLGGQLADFDVGYRLVLPRKTGD